MHVLWINEVGDLTGGAEHYIRATASRLRESNVRQTLLYGGDFLHPSLKAAFHHSEPISNLASQIANLDPGLVFAHQLPDAFLPAIGQSGVQALKFVHDHRLFCPRDRKYTAFKKRPCRQTVGWRCYPCLGFLRRSPAWPGIALQRPGACYDKQSQVKKVFTVFLTGSDYMRSHMIAHGFPSDRVHSLPLYVDLPETKKPNVVREDNLILFVGALLTGKGVDILLSASALMKTAARLWIVGAGKQETRYRNQVEQLGLTDRVTFKETTTRSELFRLYKKAALVAYPSRNPETFGLVGIEAMSQGTPVAGTRVGAVTEWLRHEKTGLVCEANDPVGLAASMDRMLSDRKLRENLGENGRRMVAAEFSPDRHVRKLVAVFEKTAGVRS